MGSWQLSLPEDWARSGLDGLAELLVPAPNPHRSPCPSSGFGLFQLVLPVGGSRSDGPKVRVLLSCPQHPPGQALPRIGLCLSTVGGDLTFHLTVENKGTWTQTPHDAV